MWVKKGAVTQVKRKELFLKQKYLADQGAQMITLITITESD